MRHAGLPYQMRRVKGHLVDGIMVLIRDCLVRWWAIRAHHMLRRMVAGEGAIRSLPNHVVAAPIELRNRLLVLRVCQLWRPYLRTTVVRCWSREWWLRNVDVDSLHPVAARDEGLGHWVKGMVSIIAPGNWVLPFGVERARVYR